MGAARLSSVCRLYEMRCEMCVQQRADRGTLGAAGRRGCFALGLAEQKMDSRKAAMVGLGRYG